MKTMLASLASWAAKWALGYTGDAVSSALTGVNSKLSGKAYTESLCTWSADTAALLSKFASALADGEVTEEERSEVSSAAQALADRLKELIP